MRSNSPSHQLLLRPRGSDVVARFTALADQTGDQLIDDSAGLGPLALGLVDVWRQTGAGALLGLKPFSAVGALRARALSVVS